MLHIKQSNYFYFNTVLLLCLFSSDSFASKTTQIDISFNGKQPSSNADSGNIFGNFLDINANGRYVAFQSYAYNLISVDDTFKHYPEIYVRDLLTHKTEKVSFLNELTGKERLAHEPSISADGRYIAFKSVEKDFETTNNTDIFVRDRLSHTIEQISVSSSGKSGNSSSFDAHISADGRYVLFSSNATNLVAGSFKGNVYIRDRLTQKTEGVNVSPKGIKENSYSFSINSNARYVTFTSESSNFVTGDNNNHRDVFLHDRLTHKTERISKVGGYSGGSSLSANGRYVAFLSEGITEGIEVYDRLTHKIERISSILISQGQNFHFAAPSISADGRFLSFQHVNIDTQISNIYVYNRLTHETRLINIGLKNVKNGIGYETNISADGRYVAFDYNVGNTNIFVHDHFIDTKNRADLKISVTKEPSIKIEPNSKLSYVYTISNNSNNTVKNVSLIHLTSGEGSAISFKPSQGSCNFSTIESICHLGKLAAGKKLTLSIIVKAPLNKGKRFNQQITVSGEPIDPIPANNYISISTCVPISSFSQACLWEPGDEIIE